MSFVPVQVMGRIERRRRFSAEQKLAIVAEALAPGSSISAVARKYGLLPSQVFKWRRLAELGVIDVPGASELPSLVGADVGAAQVPSSERPCAGRPMAGMVEVVLTTGARVRITGSADPAVVTAAIAALSGGAR